MLNINSDISTPNYKYILDPRWFNYLDAETRAGYPNHLNNSESLALLDWQDEFYQPAAVSEINLNVSGGSENTSYMFSGGVFNQEDLHMALNIDVILYEPTLILKLINILLQEW